MTSNSVDPSMLGHPPFAVDIDESELEDEVDQLDSDSDVEDGSDPDASSTSMKKSGSGKGGARAPGHSVLPSLKLENIIQADGVTGNLALSKEGLFILSIATEEFIKRMTQAGQRQASAERRNLISYRDMAMTTQQYQEFMFLHDTIPTPVSLSEALLLREAKEKELLEEDPAMSETMHASASISGPSFAQALKGKGKSRAPNGKERLNGSASSSRQESRSGSKGRWNCDDPSNEDLPNDGARAGVPEGTWISEWSDGQATSRPSPDHSTTRPSQNGAAPISSLLNGHDPVAPVRSRGEGTDPPSPAHHSHHSHHSPIPASEETWPGQYTGPASGFLQDPRGPFGRVVSNPGRTIYSHQHRQE